MSIQAETVLSAVAYSLVPHVQCHLRSLITFLLNSLFSVSSLARTHARRVNHRYLLTGGMLLSSLFTFMFGALGPWLRIYSVYYYAVFWGLNGRYTIICHTVSDGYCIVSLCMLCMYMYMSMSKNLHCHYICIYMYML